MSHIGSIGAGVFSDLSVCLTETDEDVLAAITTDTVFQALFVDEDTGYTRIKNVREFPSMGTPPNVVNVPVYGQKTSQQVQGQSDAPSMEIQLNFIADDWSSDAVLGAMVGDGVQRMFRFTLLNAKPVGTDPYDSITDGEGLDSVDNSQYYWVGKIEALQVNPQLTDANTATVTITVQSDFNGAFTSTSV